MVSRMAEWVPLRLRMLIGGTVSWALPSPRSDWRVSSSAQLAFRIGRPQHHPGRLPASTCMTSQPTPTRIDFDLNHR